MKLLGTYRYYYNSAISYIKTICDDRNVYKYAMSKTLSRNIDNIIPLKNN